MAQQESGKTYRWAYPSEWLAEKVDDAVDRRDVFILRGIVNDLLSRAAEDDIQDVFQAEMDADGYFQPIAETCAYCHQSIPRDADPYVPDPDDDEAWTVEGAHHANGCEWVSTRAYQRELSKGSD